MNANRNRTVFVILILVFLGLLSPQTVLAQVIEVNAADPNSAEQGTEGLDVKLTGKGFEKGATVRFFLFDTEEDGGIIVHPNRGFPARRSTPPGSRRRRWRPCGPSEHAS